MVTTDLVSAAERSVAWLRLAAIALIVAAETLPHPNPNRSSFHIAAAVVFVYAIAAVAWAYRGPVTRRTVLAFTAVDVVAISVLAFLSGGAYSEARLAYFLIPIAVCGSVTSISSKIPLLSTWSSRFSNSATALKPE